MSICRSKTELNRDGLHPFSLLKLHWLVDGGGGYTKEVPADSVIFYFFICFVPPPNDSIDEKYDLGIIVDKEVLMVAMTWEWRDDSRCFRKQNFTVRKSTDITEVQF